MKLKVPFVRNKKKWSGKGWCGPIALASILRYYKIRSSVEEIAKSAKMTKEGGATPHSLIYFCLKKRLNVKYYNQYKEFKNTRKQYPEKLKNFFKKVKAAESGRKFQQKCKKFENYKFVHKSPMLKDIEENGLDALSDKISGHYAWFRGLELAFTLNRLRGFNVIQKDIDAI